MRYERNITVETISDIISRRHQIVLGDERDDVKDKSYIIAKILSNVDIGKIVYNTEINKDDGTIKYYVVEGSEIVDAIISFAENEFALSKIFLNSIFGEKNIFITKEQTFSELLDYYCFKKWFLEYRYVAEYIGEAE